MVGKTLSHYRILDELGRGGMGIVYKAEDTKLDRTVAIKVLPTAALSSEDDRARFYREAKAAAQLHHPHIASVFEIDEAVPSDAPHGTEPSPFIAMEFIEGETLDTRVKKGPLKLADAVRIAREVASALEVAHAKGIVHRDIKAANVMLTEKSSAKVLDFGLAQTAQSTKLTQMGSTLGTVAYMSPEQARGEAVDAKTDLWSLGVVLYEMVAGRSPFPGDYEQAVIYEILNQDPEPLTAVRTGVPMELEGVINRCLAKDPGLRYPLAEALIVDLKRIEASSGVRSATTTTRIGAPATGMVSTGIPAAATANETATGRAWAIPATVGAIMLVVGLFVGKVVFKEAPPAQPVVKAQLFLPDALSPLEAAITPDNRALYYVITDPETGQSRLAAYDFETGERNPIPQTEGARVPLASLDGRWIAFRRNETLQWWRLPTSGGAPTPIQGAINANLVVPAGFTPDGEFLFSDSTWSIAGVDRTGTFRVVAESGSAGMTEILGIPSASPIGGFISWISVTTNNDFDTWILGERDDEPNMYLEDAAVRMITSSGHALFTRGNLAQINPVIAVPIDLNSGEILGEEVSIGARSLTVSPSGLLVYEEFSGDAGPQPSRLYRVSESGTPELLHTLPGVASQEIAISRNGTTLLLNARPEIGADPDMYTMDLESGTYNRITSGGNYDIPAWGGNDEYLYFDFLENPDPWTWNIRRRRADGSGVNEAVLPDSVTGADPNLTPDGRLLVFSTGLNDIWGMDLTKDSVFAIVAAEGQQNKPAISPDGQYVAYVQGGNPCGSIQVSAVFRSSEPNEIDTRGCHPVWTADGTYIYYQDERSVSRVRVTTNPVFSKLTLPEEVFGVVAGKSLPNDGALSFDVAGDGTLYVAHALDSGLESNPIWVVSSWFEELDRIAPRNR